MCDDHDFAESVGVQDNLRFRGESAETGNNKNSDIYTDKKVVSWTCVKCQAWKGQLGLEVDPRDYIDHLSAILEKCCEKLKPDGTMWVNIGDTYAANRPKRCSQTLHGGEIVYDDIRYNGISMVVPEGMKPKDVIGIPWMLAFRLRDSGMYLRMDIIWSKPNPVPESVKDRPTKAHEYIFLLSKSREYYYDHEAIKEPTKSVKQKIIAAGGNINDEVTEEMRNRRSVWEIAVQCSKEEHYAMYPEELVELCVRAGTKEGDTVLDPFSGSGTTGIVSLALGRNYIGIDLNPEHVDRSLRRVGKQSEEFPLWQ